MDAFKDDIRSSTVGRAVGAFSAHDPLGNFKAEDLLSRSSRPIIDTDSLAYYTDKVILVVFLGLFVI